MSVTKFVDLHPVDVDVFSLAVVVKAVSADGGAEVIAPSPTNAAAPTTRVARRKDPRALDFDSLNRRYGRSRGSCTLKHDRKLDEY